MKGRRISEELRRLVGVDPITTVIEVKKRMELKAEDRLETKGMVRECGSGYGRT